VEGLSAPSQLGFGFAFPLVTAKVFQEKHLFPAFPEQNWNILLLQCSTSGHHQILTAAPDDIYLEIT